jgi:hypothetical protein
MKRTSILISLADHGVPKGNISDLVETFSTGFIGFPTFTSP